MRHKIQWCGGLQSNKGVSWTWNSRVGGQSALRVMAKVEGTRPCSIMDVASTHLVHQNQDLSCILCDVDTRRLP